MSNYAAKFDLKSAKGVNTSKFWKEDDLGNLKLDIKKLDIDKLETTPTDLSKLKYEVKSHVVKKTVYEELVKKFNVIETI